MFLRNEMSSQNRELASDGLATRSRGKVLALLMATMVAVFLAWRLVAPFLPAIVLAFTLAIVTHRPMVWLRQRWPYPHLTAGLGTLAVAIAFLLPTGALVYFTVIEIGQTVEVWRAGDMQEYWQQLSAEFPRMQQLWTNVARDLRLDQTIPQALEQMHRVIASAIGGAVYVGAQGLLTLFFLFFLYRDEHAALRGARRLMPLNDQETDELFQRVDDTVHATIFGTVCVATIQGALGGAIFAVLGIPGAVLWGVVMGALSIIPYLGAFVIWGPAAVLLMTQGEMVKATVLVAFGLVAIGLIDNMLYPLLVGQRLNQHTAVAFIAILGGVAVFGATGIVLGPVVMTVVMFLLEVWRQRTTHGAAAENA
jgi:predicted PurR-regulated permease PerM